MQCRYINEGEMLSERYAARCDVMKAEEIANERKKLFDNETSRYLALNFKKVAEEDEVDC